jgi:hypothetical protein
MKIFRQKKSTADCGRQEQLAVRTSVPGSATSTPNGTQSPVRTHAQRSFDDQTVRRTVNLIREFKQNVRQYMILLKEDVSQPIFINRKCSALLARTDDTEVERFREKILTLVVDINRMTHKRSADSARYFLKNIGIYAQKDKVNFRNYSAAPTPKKNTPRSPRASQSAKKTVKVKPTVNKSNSVPYNKKPMTHEEINAERIRSKRQNGRKAHKAKTLVDVALNQEEQKQRGYQDASNDRRRAFREEEEGIKALRQYLNNNYSTDNTTIHSPASPSTTPTPDVTKELTTKDLDMANRVRNWSAFPGFLQAWTLPTCRIYNIFSSYTNSVEIDNIVCLTNEQINDLRTDVEQTTDMKHGTTIFSYDVTEYRHINNIINVRIPVRKTTLHASAELIHQASTHGNISIDLTPDESWLRLNKTIHQITSVNVDRSHQFDETIRNGSLIYAYAIKMHGDYFLKTNLDFRLTPLDPAAMPSDIGSERLTCQIFPQSRLMHNSKSITVYNLRRCIIRCSCLAACMFMVLFFRRQIPNIIKGWHWASKSVCLLPHQLGTWASSLN